MKAPTDDESVKEPIGLCSICIQQCETEALDFLAGPALHTLGKVHLKA